MKKHYLIALGLVVVCGCVAFGLPALSPTPPGITKDNFERVKVGMKKEEVEAIFGREGTVCELHGTQFPRWSTFEWTRNDKSKAIVDFQDDRVIEKSWAGLPSENVLRL